MTRWLSYGLLLLVVACPGVYSNQDAPQVQQLLSQMSRALRELNYQGLFTYEYGGPVVDTVRIVHGVEQGVETERLEHLSGPYREVVRRGKKTDCTAPGEVLLRGQLDLLKGLNARVRQLSTYYDFQLRGRQRIAGREAVFIQVVPKDEYRYGFTLAIDMETHLPLLSILVGEKNKVLERFQFVELQVGIPVSPQTFEPTVDGYLEVIRETYCQPMQTPEDQRWMTGWLPGGYVFSGQKTIRSRGDMLTYTDGLSTFSIFVESAHNGLVLEGRAQRGATVAHMSKVANLAEPHSVTVVGEIPPLAAQRIAASVRPSPQ